MARRGRGCGTLVALAAVLGRGLGDGEGDGATTTAAPSSSGHWMLADDGLSCDGACARLGKLCSEDHWPESPRALLDLASGIGHPCEDVQSGDVGYDPSMDGTFCGWRSNWVVPEQGHDKTRCGAKPPWSTRRFCFCHGVLDTTTMPYDCLSGLASDRSGPDWSDHKRQWCCLHQGLGCTTTPAPFDCMAGLAAWERGWSEGKKDWCCRHQHRGCSPTSGSGFTESTTKSIFDCGTGYSNWMMGWSESKKDWCCRFENVGCTTVTTTTTLPFDCDASDHDWSQAQRDWCCNQLGKGCLMVVSGLRERGAAEETFDCQSGYSTWGSAASGWSNRKKEWCCENVRLGCPFNCVAGYSNWRTGWSYAKKGWCCLHQRLGCDQGEVPHII